MLVAAAFGLLIGLVIGAVGGGGAVLAVPVLVYAVGLGVHEATTASLAVVAAAAVTGTAGQVRRQTVCWTSAAWFAGGAGLGGVLGAAFNRALGGTELLLLFSAVMLIAARATWQRAGAPAAVSASCPPPSPRLLIPAGLAVGALTGLGGDRLVHVRVERPLGGDLLDPLGREQGGELVARHPHALDHARLLVMLCRLERTAEVVEHRQQPGDDPLAGALDETLVLPRRALAVVVEVRGHTTEVAEQLVALRLGVLQPGEELVHVVARLGEVVLDDAAELRDLGRLVEGGGDGRRRPLLLVAQLVAHDVFAASSSSMTS